MKRFINRVWYDTNDSLWSIESSDHGTLYCDALHRKYLVFPDGRGMVLTQAEACTWMERNMTTEQFRNTLTKKVVP